MVRLLAPYNNPQVGIMLPNPDFGNTESVDLKSTFVRMLSRGMISFKQTDARRSMSLRFSNLKKGTLDGLLLVLTQADSDYFLYCDHVGQIWKLQLLTKDPSAVAGPGERFSIELSFTGVVVHG
jgi:hypothetical protein